MSLQDGFYTITGRIKGTVHYTYIQHAILYYVIVFYFTLTRVDHY